MVPRNAASVKALAFAKKEKTKKSRWGQKPRPWIASKTRQRVPARKDGATDGALRRSPPTIQKGKILEIEVQGSNGGQLQLRAKCAPKKDKAIEDPDFSKQINNGLGATKILYLSMRIILCYINQQHLLTTLFHWNILFSGNEVLVSWKVSKNKSNKMI